MNIHGFKKQKGQAQKPHIAPDDLVSTSVAKILYGLAEGEISGLADGGKSIKLDGTPLINDNGQENFAGVTWDFRTGTLDQSHILGFPAVENETNVGVELRSDRAWIKQINNRELSAVRVRLNFNALREQKDNGDIVGYAIEYAIDVQTDGGSFQEVQRHAVRGKSSQGYKKSHRIDLPKGNKWTIRVRRITPNRNSELIGDTVHIDALTEIIDAKLAYPCTALLALSYNAKTFANIAKLAVRLKGKIIQVPSNYNEITRQYNGLWDGTFKLAYSNNPAWVFYDLCTHKRYGLGERLAGMVDKWRLYQIGQYCDELVDDGKGGQEPRFTVNVYIQKADDAYRVLQNLASVFRGLSFWDGSNIVVDADTPKEPVYTFSAANIVGGEFAYTGTRARDRHTLAKVAWDNPENAFSTEYELIPDEQAIAKYGVRVLDISAFGCTSKGQAQRAGLWALKAEQLETQTVSFKTGLQGFIPQVGQVINVADNVFAGRAVSGKIMAVSTNKRQITLDRTAGKVGDTLTVNGTDGVQTAKITAIRGQVLTIDKPINAENEHIWAVISDDLKLKQFRILTIVQNDDATFDITALEYNAQKYAVVDNGAIVTPQPYTVLKATPITAPNTVTLTANTRTVQGQAVTTLNINWEQVTGAVAYIVKWRKDDGNWQTLPKVSGQSVDIDGVYAGNYTAQVQAVDSFDNESLATTSQLTNIAGKTGKPPRLTSLTVQGVLFGMNLGWAFARGSDDTNFTEIQVSPDGRSNITTLGTFAYPTNKHEITGLQGGLTQFYRARIVDKLGNTSDWTAWVRGVTDNQAEKVLNLISGQINESHLHQNLSTPIAKIGGLETDLNGVKTQLPNIRTEITNAKTSLQNAIDAVNAQLPTLNSQIATLNSKTTTLQNELNTAKSTLQTAVGNITTERNRINTAIRDITTLQTANTAKTQELANLTQTVGGHTSSIRELGVTTGDLSQKYSQLKTATDTANSEITAIKQTQNGQATSIERLGAKFDNLSVGGRNLLLNTGTFKDWQFSKHNSETTTRLDPVDGVATLTGTQAFWKQWYQTSKQDTVASRPFANALLNDVVDGQNYVISYEAKGDVPLRLFVRLHYTDNTSHNTVFVNQTLTDNWQRYTHTVTLAHAQGKADLYRHLSFIIEHNRIGTLQIRKVKLEKGNIATDWTPAPEDLQADIDSKATTANLETLRQTLTDADTALSGQITAMDTAYKSADRTLTANLASEITARTNADTALGQRIDTLQADYNGNKASVANQLKTLTDKDTATATQISSLTANVTTAQNTANNALNRANTANSAITAEQKARADADNSLASQITALDTAYKSADSQLSGRITTAQQTATNAQNAVASVQSELTAKFDSLAVGGRNYLLNSDFATTKHDGGNLRSQSLAMSNAIKMIATPCTLTVSAHFKLQNVSELANDVRMLFLVRFTHADGTVTAKQITYNAKTRTDIDKRLSAQVGITKPITGFAHTYIDVYGITAEMASIARPQIELGTIATDWTPAPEDTQSQLDDKASTATLNEFKQTSANADTALGERITAIDTAYKQADTATNAKLANAEKAISDNNTALSERITALDTAYKSADNNLTARLAREETARASGDNANAQAIRTLESTVNGIGGRVGTSESKIATLERTTSDTNQALATAQNQLNARFDNLSVGGRNLLRNTQNPTATSPIYHATANAPRLDGVTVAYENEVMTVQATKASNRLALAVWSDSRLDLEPNTDYVLSGYVKAQSDVRLATRWFRYVARWINQVVTFNATTEWTKFTVRFSMPDEQITGAFLDLVINVPMGNMVSFKSLKLEKGSIPTDYTPAPEDTQSQLDEKASTATLDEFKRTQAQKDTATASQISQLTANVSTAQQTANTANGKADTATTKADNAQSTANNALSRANTANSAITAEQKARADADTALGQRITAIDTAYKSADSQTTAKLGQLEQAITTANQAIATAQSQLTAKFDALKVGGRNLILNSKQTLTVPAGGASNRENQQIRMSVANIDWTTVKQLTLSVDVKHADDLVRAGNRWWRIALELAVPHTDGTTSYPKAMITAPVATAFNGRIAYVWDIPKEIRTVNYAVIFVQNINSSHDIIIANPKLEIGNIATDWTPAPEDTQSQLDEKASTATLDEFKRTQAQKDTATAQAVQTLQTTVNGQSASIQQHAQSLNGLSAQWALKVQSGNIVSGIGLASSNGVSDFAVRADKFYIAPPTGTGKGDIPFTVLTSPQVINGVQVPAGTYIKSAFIQDGSITNAKIANASIDNAKIANGSIDNAKIANGSIDTAKIRDGVITTAKIGVAQIDTLQIAGEAVTVPRMQYNAGIRHFTQGGEIELGRMTMNSQGGNVMITIGFARLFSVPNGIYSWGKFVPAVEDNDFHNFAHIHANNMTGVATGDISFHVRRNDVEIHRVVFKPNYAKSGTSAITSVSRVDPILLYDQYTMPYILDTPPAGDNVYSIVMTVHSNRVYSNSDRTIERQTRLTGFSFMALGVKR